MKYRIFVRLFFFLVTFACVQGMSAKDLKIYVIADPHVMESSLLIKDGSAWRDYLSTSRKMEDYSQSIFDLQIAQIKKDKPDILLVAGDMTKDGERKSHIYVIEKLEELVARGIKVFVVPGNHDCPAAEDMFNSVAYNGGSVESIDVITETSWIESRYGNMGYHSAKAKDTNSASYVCEPYSNLVLICIDSHTGALSSGTVDWVCSQARSARQSGKQVIAMMHHGLVEHFLNQRFIDKTALVEDNDNIRKKFIDAGIHVIFTGHFHASDIAKDYNSDLTECIYDISVGSPISYPCDFRVVTLSSDYQTMRIETQVVTDLKGFPVSASEAKQRLYTSSKLVCKQKLADIFSNFGDDAADDQLDKLAGSIADAFIIYAEGNEELADAKKKEEIKENFSSFSAFGFDEMLESLLEDISNYGVRGREDVTDDHTLSINVSTGAVTAISPVNASVADDDNWYTLQGVRVSKPTKGIYIHQGRLKVVKE